MLYHREVFWKDNFDKESLFLIRTAKGYSFHMLQHFDNVDYKHNIERIVLTNIVRRLQKTEDIKPYEVEVENGKVVKCVVRVSYNKDKDVSIVFRFGKVITAWLNSKEDIHNTLDASKYAIH